jgi:hypothetical protein
MGYAATLSFWSSEIEGLSKLALKRHYLKLKNQKVDLFTELSQGLLTVNLIVDIAKRIAKTLLFFKEARCNFCLQSVISNLPERGGE